MDKVYVGRFSVWFDGDEPDTAISEVATSRVDPQAIWALNTSVDEDVFNTAFETAMLQRGRTVKGAIVDTSTGKEVYTYGYRVYPCGNHVHAEFFGSCDEIVKPTLLVVEHPMGRVEGLTFRTETTSLN